jgi:hypothetical protein
MRSFWFVSSAVCLLAATVASGQWEPDIQATNFPGSGKSITAEPAASVGHYVYLVWDDSRDPSMHETYFKRSTDDGATWEADVRLTPADAYWSPCGSVAAQGTDVYVVWHELRHTSSHPANEEIYYLHSPDNGATWDPEVRLTDDTMHSWHPRIAVRDDNIHVVWADYRTSSWQVWYKRSTDSGVSWGADVRLSNGTGIIEVPELAVTEENVHVVWQDNRHGTNNHEVYYIGSTDNGAIWGPEARLTTESHESYAPVIAAAGENVHVVWVDYRDLNSEVYYKHSTDNGTTWSSDQNISNTSSNPSLYTVLPSVAASGRNVHVVWADDYDGNDEIYYRFSGDNGDSWADRVRLTNEPAASVSPVVVLTDSAVKVVWPDLRAGANFELFYKRNPTGNMSGLCEERGAPGKAGRSAASIIRGSLFLPAVSGQRQAASAGLLDISGRKVADLRPGANDVSRFAPGVYFARSAASGERSAVCKVVIGR